MIQFNQRILIYLSFVVLANANNLIKKDIKEPKVQVETRTVHLIQQPKRSPIPLNNQLDNSFMPVFLTSSNVKANDFTQEMLKSLATNNFIKPSVKSLSSINKSSSKSKNKSTIDNKKIKNSISTNSELSNKWSKAGSTSNFSPTLPINLNMHFDTTGFIPIVPKQTNTRLSSNAKLIKQASKPITSKSNVNSNTILLSTKPTQTSLTKQTTNSKRKQLINDLNKLINKDKNVLPNPSIRPLKSIKSNIKLSNLRSSFKPLVKATTIKPISTTNSKIIDNRPIVASSTELNNYLTSRDARKALLKMNTLRYLAKLSPHWSASSLSETYQTKVGNGPLKAYPISKITIPASGSDSYGNGYGSKKPDISIDLIKEILHKLTNDEVQFNKLYVMGTHRYKDSNNQQYNNQDSSDGAYQSDNDQYQNGGSYQQDSGNSYQENNNQSNDGYQQEGGYSQPENSNGYNQQDNGGYSQPDYSQPEGGNNYEANNSDSYGSNDSGYSNGGGGDSYSNNGGGEESYSNNNNEGDNYSNNGGGDNYSNGNNDQGNSYSNDQGNSNEGGNSYGQNGGDSDQEQGYHLQSLGYDMSQYDNRAYVPAYSLHSLADFVHTKFKETAMKKQRGEYEFNDNPYVNNYENYKSMDVNYAQHIPDQNNNMNGGGKKKCSKNKNNQNNQNNGNKNNYANNDVNFDDTYNNYGMPQMVPNIWYNNNNNGDQNGRSSRCNKHRF